MAAPSYFIGSNLPARAPNARTADRAQAFETLYRENHRRAYQYAYHLAKNAEDAQDLLQAALVKAWSSFDSFDGRSGFAPWFSAILGNTFLDQRRARRRRVELVSWTSDSAAENARTETRGVDSEALTIDGLQKQVVYAAIEKLPLKQRRVVILCDILDMTYRECAVAERIPVGTVRSRLNRARKQLAALIKSGK